MHSIYRERGEEKWEGNKQVIVYIYRQELWEAIIDSECEFNFQNNVKFKFQQDQNLLLAYQ